MSGREVECEQCMGTGCYGFRDDDTCRHCDGSGYVDVNVYRSFAVCAAREASDASMVYASVFADGADWVRCWLTAIVGMGIAIKARADAWHHRSWPMRCWCGELHRRGSTTEPVRLGFELDTYMGTLKLIPFAEEDIVSAEWCMRYRPLVSAALAPLMGELLPRDPIARENVIALALTRAFSGTTFVVRVYDRPRALSSSTT